MDLLLSLGLKAASETFSNDDLHALLVAVLPTFISVAERRRDGLSDPANADTFTNKERFYLHFNTVAYNLNAFLTQWEPNESIRKLSEEENEIKKHMMKILGELEHCFISQKVEKAGRAFKCLGLERRDSEKYMYPKLRALARILPEDETFDENFLGHVDCIIRIDHKAPEKQDKLLQIFGHALDFFYKLLPDTSQSDSQCPLRLSDYPMKHVRKLATALFEVLQSNWHCQCPGGSSHVNRKTRLNLTQNQRFGTTRLGMWRQKMVFVELFKQ